jgi:pimeloyl-ACP methyl ester carboxylesterase
MHWSYLTLAGVLLMGGLLITGVTIAIMAFSILRPPRMSDGKALWVLRRMSPGDVGLQFETVWFQVRDERSGNKISISGWWIPCANADGRCVILLHGYADAKVGAIAWAPLWHELGFNILAIDLRAHGESEGIYSTGGYWERHDISQVINEIRAQRPSDTQKLVLFGASLGATVAVATAALRDDLSAIILDSPYNDFCDAAMAQMDRLGAPGRPFQVAALWLAGKLGHADFANIRLLDLLPKTLAPVLAILPERDPLTAGDLRQQIENAISERASQGSADQTWVVPDCDHLLALACKAGEYREHLERFVHQTLDAPPQQERGSDKAPIGTSINEEI